MAKPGEIPGEILYSTRYYISTRGLEAYTNNGWNDRQSCLLLSIRIKWYYNAEL